MLRAPPTLTDGIGKQLVLTFSLGNLTWVCVSAFKN